MSRTVDEEYLAERFAMMKAYQDSKINHEHGIVWPCSIRELANLWVLSDVSTKGTKRIVQQMIDRGWVVKHPGNHSDRYYAI